MQPSRRQFLQSLGVVGLSQTLFPAWMPKLAFAAPGAAVPLAQNGDRDILVVVFQRGGMDALNAIVPFAEGGFYYDKRPTLAIPAPDGGDSSAIDLNGFFGLHPALRELKDLYDANQLTLIHAAGSPDPTRSHFDAMEYMERGIPGDKLTGTGWINRHLQTAAWANESPFRAIGMGTLLQSSLRGEIAALSMKSIADFHLGGRSDQLRSIQQTLAGLYSVQAPSGILSQQAASVFGMMAVLQQFSALDYSPENSAAYPETDFGMGLRQIAQLIKADVGLEIACVDIGGWDTHDYQGGLDGTMPELLREFAGGLRAFHTDLGERMRGVTVVTMSEFGRTSVENASQGTDHGRASAMFVMGGGATGGIHADWRGLSPEVLDDGDLAVTTDYRDVLAEVLLKRVGAAALDQIFPGYTPNMPGIIGERA